MSIYIYIRLQWCSIELLWAVVSLSKPSLTKPISQSYLQENPATQYEQHHLFPALPTVVGQQGY